MVADFAAVVQSLWHVHLKDLVNDEAAWRFCLPGTGILDPAGFLGVLGGRTSPIGVIRGAILLGRCRRVPFAKGTLKGTSLKQNRA